MFEIIKKDKKNFDIILLSANNNYKKLIQQAKQFNVKNVLIKNKKFYLKVKNALKKTKVYSGDVSIKKIISRKLDYTMSAVVGLAGLQLTIDAIKISKTVAIANKETIICGWQILSKFINKYKTKENEEVETQTINQVAVQNQLKRLSELKVNRNKDRVQKSLAILQEVASEDRNILPYIIDAVKAHVTLGEISNTLKKVFGTY